MIGLGVIGAWLSIYALTTLGVHWLRAAIGAAGIGAALVVLAKCVGFV
jgi:hypothetical protein